MRVYVHARVRARVVVMHTLVASGWRGACVMGSVTGVTEFVSARLTLARPAIKAFTFLVLGMDTQASTCVNATHATHALT